MIRFVIAAVALALCIAPADSAAAAQEKTQADKPQTGPDTAKPETHDPVKPMSVPVSVDPSTYTLGPDLSLIHI